MNTEQPHSRAGGEWGKDAGRAGAEILQNKKVIPPDIKRVRTAQGVDMKNTKKQCLAPVYFLLAKALLSSLYSV